MSHRNLTYLNNNRIIYRRYSSDIPTSNHRWGWYYAEGTYGYYALFNNKAKINTIRSLKWHLLTLWYLIPKLAKALKCTTRTIYRHMSKELKEEKKLLNNQYEKI